MKIEQIVSGIKRYATIPLLAVALSSCRPECILSDACSNHPPSVGKIELLPENPRDNDTLNLRYSVSDREGSKVSEEIRWVRNGAEFSTTYNQKRILPEYTKTGEIWYADINISNGTHKINMRSPSVRIGN